MTPEELAMVGECPTCRAHFVANGVSIIVSAHEVGREQDRTTQQIMKEYMVSYHRDGHQ